MDRVGTLKSYSKHLTEFALNILFPRHCLSCNSEGSWVCRTCENTLKRVRQTTCPFCKKEGYHNGNVCEVCKKETGIDVAWFLYSFEDPLVRKWVHGCKYKYIEELGESMGKRLAPLLEKKLYNGGLVPVPLHKKRQNERGFNQAGIMTRSISKETSIYTTERLVTRIRYTDPQAKLDKQGRGENLKRAFLLNEEVDIQDKVFCIIDDVFTTGATAAEMARILKQGGARTVVLATFAHGT